MIMPHRSRSLNAEMSNLVLTSCMASNADFLVENIAGYLAQRLAMPVSFVNDIPWRERERRLDNGSVHVCWLCGLPYVWKADSPHPPVELLVAPVMAGERYAGRPVYFSDVVVHEDSPFQSFSDLRGRTWAYNEPRSHSGYMLTRYQLALRGEDGDYFGRVVAAGTHQRALHMILSHEAHAAAIDSTVLELAIQQQPAIEEHVRIIDSWGPSPIPPWVILKQTPPRLRRELQRLLLHMHEDPRGRRILQQGRMAHFVRVADEDYDPIRHMAQKAKTVTLRPSSSSPDQSENERSAAGESM